MGGYIKIESTEFWLIVGVCALLVNLIAYVERKVFHYLREHCRRRGRD